MYISLYMYLSVCVCMCVCGLVKWYSAQHDAISHVGQFQKQWQRVEDSLTEWEEKHRQLQKEQDKLDDNYRRLIK